MTVMLAICTILMLAFTAFCIDIGWATVSQSGLQNAADSTAAAAAAALNQGYASYSIPTQTSPSGIIASAESTAITWAKSYANYNGSADLSSLTLSSSDVVFSQSNAAGALLTSFTGFPNTVTVTLRRNGSANPLLPLFFAPAIGTKNVSQAATASATIYTGVITSFSATGGGQGSAGGYGGWGTSYSSSGSSNTFNNLLLPVALDVNTWSAYVDTGSSASNSSYYDYLQCGTTGNSCYVATKTDNGNGNGGINNGNDQGKCNNGADTNVYAWNQSGSTFSGVSQCCIFPSPSNYPGMTGCIALDGSSNSDQAYCNWITNGCTASDISRMTSKGCFPCSVSSAKACKGTAGMSSTVASAFSSIVGQKRIMPVFKPVNASSSSYQACTGSGGNTTYQICGYVGVQVTSVTGSGSNTCINVQPCCVIDPTAVFDKSTLVPCGCEPLTQMKTFTCTSPKFCQ